MCKKEEHFKRLKKSANKGNTLNDFRRVLKRGTL